MAKRKRNIQILFCVSPEEKKLIRRKMIESKTKNMGAYLRKMAIDGYIVNTDTKFHPLHGFRFHSKDPEGYSDSFPLHLLHTR